MAARIPLALVILAVTLFCGCGPDTIFLRPALDTPTQHVQNGYNFLSIGKIDAASNEFDRAKSLDDRYSPAYVGIGLVQGHRGDFKNGFESMAHARELAANADEIAKADDGYKTLETMLKKSENMSQ
jgi:hypothetical protein